MSLCLSSTPWRRIRYLIKHHAVKMYGEAEVYLHAFLISALDVDEWLLSRPSRFTPWERAPGTIYIRGWVGPHSRSGYRGEEKEIPSFSHANEPGRSAHSLVTILTEVRRLLSSSCLKCYIGQNINRICCGCHWFVICPLPIVSTLKISIAVQLCCRGIIVFIGVWRR